MIIPIKKYVHICLCPIGSDQLQMLEMPDSLSHEYKALEMFLKQSLYILKDENVISSRDVYFHFKVLNYHLK